MIAIHVFAKTIKDEEKKKRHDITRITDRPAWRRGAEFRVGETKVVSGKVSKDKYTGALVMASPDVVAPLADLKKVFPSIFLGRKKIVCDRRFAGSSPPVVDLWRFPTV